MACSFILLFAVSPDPSQRTEIPGVRALLKATYLMCKQQLMIMKHNFWVQYAVLPKYGVSYRLLNCHHPPLSFSLKKETASNILSHQHNWIWAGRHNGGQKEQRNIFWSSFEHIMLQHTAQLGNTAPFICTKQETQTLNPPAQQSEGWVLSSQQGFTPSQRFVWEVFLEQQKKKA